MRLDKCENVVGNLEGCLQLSRLGSFAETDLLVCSVRRFYYRFDAQKPETLQKRTTRSEPPCKNKHPTNLNLFKTQTHVPKSASPENLLHVKFMKHEALSEIN